MANVQERGWTLKWCSGASCGSDVSPIVGKGPPTRMAPHGPIGVRISPPVADTTKRPTPLNGRANKQTDYLAFSAAIKKRTSSKRSTTR